MLRSRPSHTDPLLGPVLKMEDAYNAEAYPNGISVQL